MIARAGTHRKRCKLQNKAIMNTPSQGLLKKVGLEKAFGLGRVLKVQLLFSACLGGARAFPASLPVYLEVGLFSGHEASHHLNDQESASPRF